MSLGIQSQTNATPDAGRLADAQSRAMNSGMDNIQRSAARSVDEATRQGKVPDPTTAFLATGAQPGGNSQASSSSGVGSISPGDTASAQSKALSDIKDLANFVSNGNMPAALNALNKLASDLQGAQGGQPQPSADPAQGAGTGGQASQPASSAPASGSSPASGASPASGTDQSQGGQDIQSLLQKLLADLKKGDMSAVSQDLQQLISALGGGQGAQSAAGQGGAQGAGGSQGTQGAGGGGQGAQGPDQGQGSQGAGGGSPADSSQGADDSQPAASGDPTQRLIQLLAKMLEDSRSGDKQALSQDAQAIGQMLQQTPSNTQSPQLAAA